MAEVPSVLSLGGPLSTGERFKPSGWAEEGDQDPYGPAIAAHKTEAEKRKALAEGFEKRRPKEEAETERALAGVERAVDRPRPAVPKMERVESPPKPEDYHKMSMAYLGAMVMLGAFGGKFIRNAANAPLAAFNGALKGWQEGNLEAYQQKSAEWKEKQQQVLDNNRARLDEYRAILEDHNASIDDQMLRAKLVAAKHQDKLTYDRADAGNYTGVAQAHDQGVAVHEKLVAATDKLIEQQTQVNDTAVERANLWKQHFATPQGQQELARLTPGQRVQVQGFIDRFADPAPAQLPAPDSFGPAIATEPPPGTPMPDATAPTARMPPDLRSPMVEHDPKKAAFQQLRRESWAKYGREPTFDEIAAGERQMHAPRSWQGMSLQEFIEETRATTGAGPTSAQIQRFQAQQRGLQVYTSGPQSKTITALNTVVSHLQTLRELGDAMNNKDYPRINQIYQTIGQNTGNPAPTNFRVASQIVGTEVMKALVTAGAGGVGEREEIKNAFQQIGSPAQIHGAIDTVDRLLVGQLRSQRQAFKNATGQPPSMFDDMLLPEVKTYFDEVERSHHEGGGGASGKPDRAGWSARPIN